MTTKNTMGGERPRNEADAYYTPDALALAIARRVRGTFGDFGSVTEPSAGGGAFVRAAHQAFGPVWIHAIEPNANPITLLLAAALSRTTWEAATHRTLGRNLIIGNPPYNLPGDGKGDKPTTAERHVTIALDRMRDGDVLAFLLRLAFLGGGGRNERLHAKHPLAALWPVTPRPSFTGGGTDSSEYAVFVWRKGHVGACDLRPLGWTP